MATPSIFLSYFHDLFLSLSNILNEKRTLIPGNVFVGRLWGSAQENVQLAALSHSHVSQPLAASSKGAPSTDRLVVKQWSLISFPSSFIYFPKSYIESLSVLQKGDNVGFSRPEAFQSRNIKNNTSQQQEKWKLANQSESIQFLGLWKKRSETLLTVSIILWVRSIRNWRKNCLEKVPTRTFVSHDCDIRPVVVHLTDILGVGGSLIQVG